MDGFVTDYISTFTGETGRQPTYDEYAQIMTGCTPEQLPVLSGIARDFGVFDHWFSEVPSQTFMNRSFWTAASSSGLVVNGPMRKWFTRNDTETLFERLEAHGKTWKVYVMEPMPLSFTGMIHFARLKSRLATHFVPFSEFERDAAEGTLPDFALIEPNMMAVHGDLPPGDGTLVHRSGRDRSRQSFVDSLRRSVLGAGVRRVPVGRLEDRYERQEHGLAHVPPGPAVPPDPSAPPGECGFTFDRSGPRVPARPRLDARRAARCI
jgi:phospholipase C